MSDSEQDDDFEAYLKRRVPIDQRMKNVDRLEPPPELDRIIIGKARNAIQSSPNVPLYRAPKWALPVGLAATLLIAFSIVLDLGIRSARQQPRTAAAASQVPAAAASAPEPMAALAPAQTAPSDSARQQPAPSRSSASAATGSSNAAASAKAFARMRPPPIKTAPWPPIRRTEKPAVPSGAASAEYATATASTAEFDARSRSAERRVAEKRLRTDESERVAAADVGSPAAQDAAPAAAAAPVPAPAAPLPRPLVDATANAEAPAPLRLAASSPKVSATTFDGAKVIEPRSAERFDSASGGVSATRAAVSPSAVAPAAAAPSTAASTVAASVADRREHPDPKVWLDQIQRMRVTGLTAQAEQELKHFRDAYPGYPTGAPDGSTQ